MRYKVGQAVKVTRCDNRHPTAHDGMSGHIKEVYRREMTVRLSNGDLCIDPVKIEIEYET